MLERVAARLSDGVAAGWHRGAQLEVRLAGTAPVSVCVGESRPGVAMTPSTLLPWFSCTKPFTAVAVAQLVERGLVSFDDPVALHVPEFGAKGKDGVLVRHVLTHTGGFRSVGEGVDVWRLEWDELVAAICAAPLEPGWVPGERAGYHAVTGFHILGELVQRVSGRSFPDYVTEEILEPLDMADSWMQLTEERYAAYGDRMGVMEDVDPADPLSSRRPVRGMDSWRGFRRASPSGGGVGPMADLVKLFEMFLGGGARNGERVLSAAMVEEISRPARVGMVDETFGMVIDWGLGLMVDSWPYRKAPASYGYGDHSSRSAFGHGGQQSSIAFCDPAFGLAVALCCNGRPGELQNHRRTQPVLTALYEELGLAS